MTDHAMSDVRRYKVVGRVGEPQRYIIEHQTRGVLVDQDHDPWGKGPLVHLEWRSRFSPTKGRTEGLVLYGAAEARRAWSRLDPKLRRSASIRRYGTWTKVPEADL